MTAPAAPWQLDRLATDAREAAEIASRGGGVSLSSWLTKLIGETCFAEGVAPPAEPPKILEFAREIRDRTPSTPRIQPAPTPIPANTSMPPPQQPIQSSAPAIEPAAAAVQPFPEPTIPPQPAAAPMQPMVFRPTPFVVAPVSAFRPLQMPPAPLHQPAMQHHAAPVAPAPIPPTPAVAPARFAAPHAFAPPAPCAVAPVVATPTRHPPAPAGATMLPVTAMVAANLGTRRGDDIPDTLLADIATHGVRQPLTVRRAANNREQYEIVCGHRRWRAAQRVGLAQIPVIVVTQDDAAAILASLAENLQLDNLSAVDEAQAYLRLLTQCALDASAITAAIGRDRRHIVQSMRLLGLPPLVRHLIGSNMLSREHAFVLLDAPQPEALADAILTERLSVEAARQRIAAGADSKP